MMKRSLDELRAAYSRFLSGDRILLTGHSHQAWPDVARDAQVQVFDDAARFVDDKWDEAIFPRVERVGRRVLARMGFSPDDAIAFGESTHQLVFRLLSCFLSGSAPMRIVTTTGEFHSLHRQLTRLEEAGALITWVPAEPRAGLSERLVAALTPATTLLACSAVLFEDAYVLERLGDIATAADSAGATVLIDAYHGFNVVPLDWGPAAERLYVVAGGYKYAAFGNGLSWMRVPKGSELRPLYTGWFADFGSLADPRVPGARVRYGAGGARFGGATFEASALYRADAVLDHWDAFGLGPHELRAISTRQTRRIVQAVLACDALELVSSRDDARRGGFVAVRHAHARECAKALRARDVWVDARGDILRIGPAPYLRDEEIERGMAAIGEVARELG